MGREVLGGHGPSPGGAAYSQRLPSNSGKGDLAHEDRAGGGKKKRQRDGNWGVDAEDAVTLETAAGALATMGYFWAGICASWRVCFAGCSAFLVGDRERNPSGACSCGGDVCWQPHLTCTAT